MNYRRVSRSSIGRLGLLSGMTMLAAAWPTLAQAHILMTSPVPRQPGKDDNKMSPCGEGAGSAKPATAKHTFKPGETIPIEWTETTPHAGWFRIALDTTGQDSLTLPSMAEYAAFPNIPAPSTNTVQSGAMWILSDHIIPHMSAAMNTKRMAMVTMPNVTCDNCTLQLIQVMTGRTYSGGFYFHCADIKLTDAGGTGGTSGAGGAAAGGASGAGGAAGGASGQGGSTTGGQSGTGGTQGTGGGAAGESGTGGDGGTAGDNGSGGGDGGGGGDDPGDDRSSGSGCSLVRSGAGANAAWLLTALAITALLRRRRRTRP